MRNFLCSLLAAFAVSLGAAQSPQTSAPAGAKAAKPAEVTAIKVQAAGIFAATTQASQKPAAEGIPFTAVKDVHLVKRTTTVQIGKGVNFGFQYVAMGKPLGERTTLHFVVIYPAPGISKPGASSPITRDEYDEKVRIGVKGSFDGYELDNDWEMLPGVWTLEIWNGTNKLASQTFTLVQQ